MRQGLVRSLLTIAIFAVVWLVSAPARAEGSAIKAPLCDPRGAITFAPPPQFQALELSLDIVLNDDDCTASRFETRHITRGQAPPVVASASIDPLLAPTHVMPVLPAGQRMGVRGEATTRRRPGYELPLDRPPRI